MFNLKETEGYIVDRWVLGPFGGNCSSQKSFQWKKKGCIFFTSPYTASSSFSWRHIGGGCRRRQLEGVFCLLGLAFLWLTFIRSRRLILTGKLMLSIQNQAGQSFHWLGEDGMCPKLGSITREITIAATRWGREGDFSINHKVHKVLSIRTWYRTGCY